jgi:hypothetical protein
MERESMDELPVEQSPGTTAANEEFTGIVTRRDGAPAAAGGWDPYEVWRTRVRAPSSKAIKARSERPHDPRP